MAQPNGLAFSPDGLKLYVDDSERKEIRVWDVTRDGGVRTGQPPRLAVRTRMHACGRRESAAIIPSHASDSGGVISGPGCMDYAHDMPPYVQEMADWLDDPDKLHPCNGESAFKGFEIMMAMCRSTVQRGKVKLPLPPGEAELAALEKALPG